ncbi:MAG: 4-hydroxy-tetrahydrodipicolinate synthase [Flavobacteriaceae bacterium]|nr:4-hydroxy-tetrahydrodipicolinate synthase [Flavobacteriaceae bacterium]
MNALIGTGVALITPFDSTGKIDTEALTRLVNYQVDNGIDYLVVLGTTAESATLTREEKDLVKSCIKKANNDRLPLVLGVGGNNTAEVCHQLTTEDLNGFSAILSVSPYYNKPTQQGIYAHFEAVAKASPLPIILYNVPGRTASNMQPKTVAQLAKDFKNIIGIKEAAGDIVQAMQLIDCCPKDFLIISGDDMITLPMVLAGGHGVISVIGEGFPRAFSDMVRLGLDGKNKAAYQIHYAIAPAIDDIFAEGNPAGIKAVLKELHICGDALRLPLVNISDGLQIKLRNFIANFKY